MSMNFTPCEVFDGPVTVGQCIFQKCEERAVGWCPPE